MECKFVTISNKGEILIELIETLWNVNTISNALFTTSGIELIETLWNVNLFVLITI